MRRCPHWRAGEYLAQVYNSIKPSKMNAIHVVFLYFQFVLSCALVSALLILFLYSVFPGVPYFLFKLEKLCILLYGGSREYIIGRIRAKCFSASRFEGVWGRYSAMVCIYLMEYEFGEGEVNQEWIESEARSLHDRVSTAQSKKGVVLKFHRHVKTQMYVVSGNPYYEFHNQASDISVTCFNRFQ